MLDELKISLNGDQLIIDKGIYEELKNTFTYECWVKPERSHTTGIDTIRGTFGTKGQTYLIAPGHGNHKNTAGVGFSVATNGISVFEHTHNYLPSVLVYRGQILDWTHIAVVYNNKVPSLYINGTFVKRGLKSPVDHVFASGTVGGINPYGYYKGHVYNLRLWITVRTQIEIKKQMNLVLEEGKNGLYKVWRFPKTSHATRVNESSSILEKHTDILSRWNIIQPRSHATKPDSVQTHIHVDPFIRAHKQTDTKDVSDIFILPGLYRNDYQNFLVPVANQLIRKGQSVSFLLDSSSQIASTPSLSPKVKVINKEEYVKNHSIESISTQFYASQILQHINAWSKMEGLTHAKKIWLKNFYTKYAQDLISTSMMLLDIRPKIVYGIHYVMNPGCSDAIQFYSHTIPVKTILIQHGFFLGEYHDFRGSDEVILWGDFHERILKQFSNRPPSVILGNPKLESLMKQYEAAINNAYDENDFVNNETELLYLFSQSPKISKQSKNNLDLFVQTVQNLTQMKVTYKLHPSFTIHHLEEYVRNGRIRPEQVVQNGDLYQLIRQADIVLGDTSTAIFEAAAFSKPVIQICHPTSEEATKKQLIFTTGTSTTELRSMLQQIQSNNNKKQEILTQQKQKIEDIFYQTKGTSARIANYLSQQCSKINR
ncbi:LamG-like jellyroll fold domain-containing protein [Evansella halocellulosilytica]|uniref:LamG-like jellyroll fold domain-containing protein n=1 Tax=Evansella halocellulosilytica TaxID=2011013 RepID=UPI000BB90EA9|nr:LamG-like jellyroll fold domain-containing protein [Evansella halocellulosilytica]